MLEQLATETGGRAFFVDETNQLGAVYDQIAPGAPLEVLPLLQSSSDQPSDAFRRVEVVVDAKGAKGAKARTIRGYYP